MCSYIMYMLNKITLGVKKCEGQSEAACKQGGATRGVPIITSASISVVDMLIFPVSVIGTKGLGSQYKYQYNSNKIIFYLVHKYS